MAYSLSLKDNALVEAAAERVRPAQINPVIGRAASNTFKDHFDQLEQSHPNKLGAPRQHFWSQARRSTSFEVLEDGALISVNQVGVRQRLQGGDIKPVNSKWLTIPARAEAYGKRAREFSNLRFAVLGRGGPALIMGPEISAAAGNRKSKIKKQNSGEGMVMFWLKKVVHQTGDPDTIPTREELVADINKAVSSHLGRT